MNNPTKSGFMPSKATWGLQRNCLLFGGTHFACEHVWACHSDLLPFSAEHPTTPQGVSTSNILYPPAAFVLTDVMFDHI